MKITKQQFKQTIKEELSGILEEKEDRFFFATTKEKEGMIIVDLQDAHRGDVKAFKKAVKERYPEYTIVKVTNQIPN